ncbi:MAG: hypothetical protein WC917_00390 [Bacilli bacterium]|jgi:hypothetical protein
MNPTLAAIINALDSVQEQITDIRKFAKQAVEQIVKAEQQAKREADTKALEEKK